MSQQPGFNGGAEILSAQERSLLSERAAELFEEYFPKVLGIASKMVSGNGENEVTEALSDGYWGLWRAARDFDPSKIEEKGLTDGAFFDLTVRGYIRHGMRDRWGRRHATEEERQKGLRVDKIDKLKPSVLYGTVDSLDEPVGRDGKSLLGELVSKPGAEDHVLEAALSELSTSRLLRALKQRCQLQEREAYFRCKFLDQTQDEVGKQMGISQMQVSRLVRRADGRVADFIDKPAA